MLSTRRYTQVSFLSPSPLAAPSAALKPMRYTSSVRNSISTLGNIGNVSSILSWGARCFFRGTVFLHHARAWETAHCAEKKKKILPEKANNHHHTNSLLFSRGDGQWRNRISFHRTRKKKAISSGFFLCWNLGNLSYPGMHAFRFFNVFFGSNRWKIVKVLSTRNFRGEKRGKDDRKKKECFYQEKQKDSGWESNSRISQ